MPTTLGGFMNLTISGHHLDVTPALHNYVVSKLERVVRHFDQVVSAGVILVVDPHTKKETRQKAEITLSLKGKVIFVACASSSLYAAVDALIDKLDRQVLRYKERAVTIYGAPARVLGNFDVDDVDDADDVDDQVAY
jgi:putative sigma-54 modulation protein